VSDPDARFSSNTTQKYITKTSGGSMIHTNFKINQNSLRKSVKNSSGKRRTHAPHQSMNSQKIGAGASKQSGMPHILMGAPNVAKQRLHFEQAGGLHWPYGADNHHYSNN